MARNVIRRSNALHVVRLWKLFAMVVLVTILSLVFVFLQIRNIKLADEIKKLEVSVEELHKRNSLLQVEIACRVKPQSLAKKMEELQLNLVSLSSLQIIEVQGPRYEGVSRAVVRREGKP